MYCGKCKIDFDEDKYSYWDESSSASVKLTKCPECGKIKVMKYVYDSFYRQYIDESNKMKKYFQGGTYGKD